MLIFFWMCQVFSEIWNEKREPLSSLTAANPAYTVLAAQMSVEDIEEQCCFVVNITVVKPLWKTVLILSWSGVYTCFRVHRDLVCVLVCVGTELAWINVFSSPTQLQEWIPCLWGKMAVALNYFQGLQSLLDSLLGSHTSISPLLRRLRMGRRDQRIFILSFNLIDLRQNRTRHK